MIRIAASAMAPGPGDVSGNVWRALPRNPQRGAAARRRARRRRPRRQHRRAAARYRRCRLRQDQYARAPRRPPDRQRRRSRPRPAAHVLAPGRRRDDAQGRAHRRRSARRDGPRRPQSDPLVGHLPCHRRAHPQDACGLGRARSRLHHPRPRGLRRPHEPRAPRARLLRAGAALSPQGHVPRHLLARGQCDRAAGGGAEALPLVRGVEGRADAAVRGLRRGQAGAGRARLRRPAALLGRADAGAGAGRRGRRPVRSRAGRRVPGHQRAAGRDPARPQAGRRRA